jgi:hypothetical protein
MHQKHVFSAAQQGEWSMKTDTENENGAVSKWAQQENGCPQL